MYVSGVFHLRTASFPVVLSSIVLSPGALVLLDVFSTCQELSTWTIRPRAGSRASNSPREDLFQPTFFFWHFKLSLLSLRLKVEWRYAGRFGKRSLNGKWRTCCSRHKWGRPCSLCPGQPCKNYRQKASVYTQTNRVQLTESTMALAAVCLMSTRASGPNIVACMFGKLRGALLASLSSDLDRTLRGMANNKLCLGTMRCSNQEMKNVDDTG
jgi:hypothetical protein